MNPASEVPLVPAILSAILLTVGAGITFIGAVGLLRLRQNFYQRVHAPTLGTTLGMACVALASMIYFSALESRPVVLELLIVLLVTITTPISLLVLVRAAVLRDSSEKEKEAVAGRDERL